MTSYSSGLESCELNFTSDFWVRTNNGGYEDHTSACLWIAIYQYIQSEYPRIRLRFNDLKAVCLGKGSITDEDYHLDYDFFHPQMGTSGIERMMAWLREGIDVPIQTRIYEAIPRNGEWQIVYDWDPIKIGIETAEPINIINIVHYNEGLGKISHYELMTRCDMIYDVVNISRPRDVQPIRRLPVELSEDLRESKLPPPSAPPMPSEETESKIDIAPPPTQKEMIEQMERITQEVDILKAESFAFQQIKDRMVAQYREVLDKARNDTKSRLLEMGEIEVQQTLISSCQTLLDQIKKIVENIAQVEKRIKSRKDEWETLQFLSQE